MASITYWRLESDSDQTRALTEVISSRESVLFASVRSTVRESPTLCVSSLWKAFIGSGFLGNGNAIHCNRNSSISASGGRKSQLSDEDADRPGPCKVTNLAEVWDCPFLLDLLVSLSLAARRFLGISSTMAKHWLSLYMLAVAIGLSRAHRNDRCGDTIQITNPGYLNSPGYPNSYYPRESCAWVIQAPEASQRIMINFNPHFDLEDRDCNWHLKKFSNLDECSCHASKAHVSVAQDNKIWI
ncbi:hypothetical protein scyTo_0019456 [Scyliorhinus torazame]|uniref:CUB domain-containing protein n=1 Tax=Scyliorhinus torazame TaxID=75743 RepID=A0A401Q062_SCYTO|nr:hypothetical protein [Scyliorhinus torazame]